jgi:two-component system sensor histidine kinase CpxA
MRIGRPHPNLYTRILLWFILNVAVLLLAIFAVLHWQFAGGFRGALGTIAADRLQAIGQQLHETLSATPRAEWNDMLVNLSRRHDVKVSLMSPPDRWVAGDHLELPVEAHEQLEQMLRGERGGGDRPPPPPPRPDEMEQFLFGEQFGGPLPPPEETRPAAGMRLGTFLVHAGAPKRYWSVIRLPPPTGWPLRGSPAIVVILSTSMTGGGLFFDLRPWLVGIFGAMVLSALLWMPFVRGITHSIRAHVTATEAISKGRFDVRVPEDRGDELGRLAHAVNQMAVQLDGLVRGQKRFLGDVAHELCSPIARMEMSVAIMEQQVTEKQADRLADVREELRQISALVNELLSFSKAALGQQTQPMEAVHLLPLIQEVLRTEEVVPELVALHVPPELRVQARPELLRRALGNVVRNAGLHAPGALIAIQAQRAGGEVKVAIADAGPGVPAESLPRLFDPFYRVDTSRARETGGVGLGLSIVKHCVEACGGTVCAEQAQPHGLRIVMVFASA